MKQPYYHDAQYRKITSKQVEQVRQVLNDLLPKKHRYTLEVFSNQALFTTTQDLVTETLKSLGSLGFLKGLVVDAEPGDPCDCP